MSFAEAFALFSTMFVVASIPGIGVFTVFARSLSCGLNHGLVTVAGILSGDFVFIVLTVNGLAYLSALLGEGFILIRFLGAAYLFWLGIGLLRQGSREVNLPAVSNVSLQSSYFAGLFATLANPKAILFYAGIFPAFLDLEKVGFRQVLVIMLIATFSVGTVMAGYAWLASRTRRFFNRPRSRRNLNLSAGGLMIGTGAWLLGRP